MAAGLPSILDQSSAYAPAPAAGALAEIRAAAALLATLARQVETATAWAAQRKALEAIPAARDALEAAAARLGPAPAPAARPTLCAECFQTEGEAHRPWCPHA